ncbi:MAG: hypothetical protein JNM93_09520, partial [Bacteriovoracaceae bacterium]|nr:hypothetical protein [Bacteriovoracaceae bacterium]
KTQISPKKFQKIAFSQIAPFVHKKYELGEQNPDWIKNMRGLGVKLHHARVRSIIFVHGTFAGNDPLDIIHLIGHFIQINDDFKSKIFSGLKKGQDTLWGDLGNFSVEYIKLFEAAINHQIQCQNFSWSSGNHHLARVKGTMKLIEQIYESHKHLSPHDKILLWGHSHAGQLFALMTQFFYSNRLMLEILKTAGISREEIKKSMKMRKVIKSFRIDFATFGTPPRYSWKLQRHHRLLNIINHRGADHLGGTPSGAFNTRDGDYVQQWGIIGSDIRAAVTADQELNGKLDEFLGIGSDLKLWAQNIQYRKRIPDFGKTILVDYQDSSKFPNGFKTLFGHGVYTRFETMLFNLKTVVDNFYIDH